MFGKKGNNSNIDAVPHKGLVNEARNRKLSPNVNNTLSASSRPSLKIIKDKEKELKKKEDNKKVLETPEIPMTSIAVDPKITKKMNPEFFVFIVVYTYQTPNITPDIVSAFETDIVDINDFTLGKTYAGNVAEIEYNMNIQNYITVKKKNLFETRIEKRKTPPQFNIMSNYHVYKTFEDIVQIKENQCIFFYIYDKVKNPQKIYYTKGSIFFYENGIGSTRSINVFDGNINENDKIAKIILQSNYYSKKKEGQHGGLNKDQLLRLLKEKCQNINFLYANTILPNALYDILEKNNNDTLILIKNIISQLYINISTPDDDLTKIQDYNYLHTKIYEYYYKKNVTNNEYNNELKKEIKQFIQQVKIPVAILIPYQNLKINKYIHLLNDINHSRNMTKRYEYLSFSMHASDFLDFLIRNTDPRIFTIIENMQISSLVSKIDTTKIPQFLPRIKQKIEDTTKGVYTYLKLTNFHHVPNSNNKQSYNERFEIQMHNDTRSIILQNSNIHFPFYTKDLKTDGKKIKDSRDERITQKIEKINGNEIFLDEIDIIKYDGTYIFGNFNKVFPPSDTIETITHSLQPLIEKVIAEKPVFLLGWGASGSGKTSTLISLIKKNEPGILVYLCNELGMKGYTDLQIICKEFFQPYYDYDYDGKSYIGNTPAIIESVPFNFEYNPAESNINNKFKLKNEVTHRSKHTYRPNPALTTFNEGENIGNIVKYLIDDDRLVKATTNNPNSSRSHVLCFLKFTKSDGTKGHIIIGDMAGVENKFNCSSPVEIGNFFNIKRDGQKESFYKTEITNRQHDYINGGNPYSFKNNEETQFKQSFASGFFRFDNEDKLLELYKYGQPNSLFGRVTFSSPKTAIKEFVNLILQKIGIGSFTTENLNSEILKTESVTKIESIINSYRFANNLTSDDKITLKKIVCGTMNRKYEDPSCKDQSAIWTSQVVDVLKEKIKECILYNKIIKQACEHRVTEGTYINDSLHKLSSDIINIISFKNQNTVYYVPSFVDKCLPTYCPSQSTCFSMTTKKSDPQIESTILISIYEYLNDGKKYDIIAERESVTKFYNDIEICVFCVFNWSRSANNPPPVPYVDINDLKQMVYKKEKFTIQEIQTLINSKIIILEKDKIYFKTAIDTLKEILAIKEITSTTIETNIKPKLETIEKTNATTAIGTIEFTDRIGKLNTISNSCSIDSSSKDNNYAYIYPKPLKRTKK